MPVCASGGRSWRNCNEHKVMAVKAGENPGGVSDRSFRIHERAYGHIGAAEKQGLQKAEEWDINSRKLGF